MVSTRFLVEAGCLGSALGWVRSCFGLEDWRAMGSGSVAAAFFLFLSLFCFMDCRAFSRWMSSRDLMTNSFPVSSSSSSASWRSDSASSSASNRFTEKEPNGRIELLVCVTLMVQQNHRLAAHLILLDLRSCQIQFGSVYSRERYLNFDVQKHAVSLCLGI